MALAVIVVMAVVVQLSHALEYKVGDSIGRNTVGNVDYKHQPATNTFHHGGTIGFDGSNDEIGSLQLTTGGGDKEELDSDPQRHKKRLVLTFSRTSPISETEIRDFFRKYGVIRSVYMQQGLRPRYAHIVFHSASSVKAILVSTPAGSSERSLIAAKSFRSDGNTRNFKLGGYDMEERAVRAYDLVAFKYWGPTTHLENYRAQIEEMKNMS